MRAMLDWFQWQTQFIACRSNAVCPATFNRGEAGLSLCPIENGRNVGEKGNKRGITVKRHRWAFSWSLFVRNPKTKLRTTEVETGLDQFYRPGGGFHKLMYALRQALMLYAKLLGTLFEAYKLGIQHKWFCAQLSRIMKSTPRGQCYKTTLL